MQPFLFKHFVEVTYINTHRCPKTSIHQNRLMPWWGMTWIHQCNVCQHCDSDLFHLIICCNHLQFVSDALASKTSANVASASHAQHHMCVLVVYWHQGWGNHMESIDVFWTSCGCCIPILMENILGTNPANYDMWLRMYKKIYITVSFLHFLQSLSHSVVNFIWHQTYVLVRNTFLVVICTLICNITFLLRSICIFFLHQSIINLFLWIITFQCWGSPLAAPEVTSQTIWFHQIAVDWMLRLTL